MDALDEAVKQLKAVFDEHGIDTDNTVTTYDAKWRSDAKIMKEIILREGVTNTLGAFVEALNYIEADRGNEDGEEFYESQEYKNLQHCQKVIDCVMTACDLDIEYGYGESRKVAMERFKENMRELEAPEMLKEQAW